MYFIKCIELILIKQFLYKINLKLKYFINITELGIGLITYILSINKTSIKINILI